MILDDATSEIYYAQLVEEESRRTVMAGLSAVIETKGLFCALYSDRGSHFFVTPKASRACRQASFDTSRKSAEAGGRADDSGVFSASTGTFGTELRTWQGRLPQELRLAGISTLEEANRFLRERYIDVFNRKFTVAAEQKATAFRRTGRSDLDWVFTVQTERIVAKDNTVGIGERVWQIEKSRFRGTLAGRTVTIHEHLDGRVSLRYGPHIVGWFDPQGRPLAKANNQERGGKDGDVETGENQKQVSPASHNSLGISPKTRDSDFPTTEKGMRIIRLLKHRVNSVLHRARIEEELQSEIELHIEQLTNEGLAAGMSKPEARMIALPEFGPIEKSKEECRDMRKMNWLESLAQDLRYAWRGMIKKPSFSIVAVWTLALGIRGNSAISSVINAALLKPLPYPNPDQLVLLFELFDAPTVVSFANFSDWERENRSFSSMAAGRQNRFTLGGAGLAAPERIEGGIYSWALFKTLGVTPIIGRAFTPVDDRPGAPRVAIISYGLWQRRFGGTREVLHQRIRLDGVVCDIIGVMPQRFGYPTRAVEVWTPIQALFGDTLANRDWHQLYVVGRISLRVVRRGWLLSHDCLRECLEFTARAGMATIERVLYESSAAITEGSLRSHCRESTHRCSFFAGRKIWA